MSIKEGVVGLEAQNDLISFTGSLYTSYESVGYAFNMGEMVYIPLFFLLSKTASVAY